MSTKLIDLFFTTSKTARFELVGSVPRSQVSLLLGGAVRIPKLGEPGRTELWECRVKGRNVPFTDDRRFFVRTADVR